MTITSLEPLELPMPEPEDEVDFDPYQSSPAATSSSEPVVRRTCKASRADLRQVA